MSLEGCMLGVFDGNNEGALVTGDCDGKFGVGGFDGAEVGSSLVGTLLGLDDGISLVGANVGPKVGLMDGTIEGESVVGTFEGLWEGISLVG